MHDYEVIAGWYGTIYAGTSREKARLAYRKAVNRCLDRQLSWAVTMFRDGEVVREFDGEMLNQGIEVS